MASGPPDPATLRCRLNTEGCPMRRVGQRVSVKRWAALLATGAVFTGVVAGATVSASASTRPVVRSAVSVDSALAGARGPVKVLVQEWPNAGQGPERAVARLGGHVTRNLSIIHGFAATLPASAVRPLSGTPGVKVISLDRRMYVQAAPMTVTGGNNNLPSVYRQVVGADKLSNQ